MIENVDRAPSREQPVRSIARRRRNLAGIAALLTLISPMAMAAGQVMFSLVAAFVAIGVTFTAVLRGGDTEQ